MKNVSEVIKKIKENQKKQRWHKEVYFYGIDSFNRPIFKAIDGYNFYGSCEVLFSQDATEKEVLNKININKLVYFGKSFNCEPMGTKTPHLKLVQIMEVN